MKNRISDIIHKYKSKVDYIDIRMESLRSHSFRLTDTVLESSDSIIDLGFSVRACHRGGWSFCSLNSFEKLDEFAQLAVQHARKLGNDQTFLAPVEPVIDDVLPDYGEDPKTIPLKMKIEMFQEYAQQCRDFSDKIIRVKSLYKEKYREILLITSEGTVLNYEKLDLAGSITPFAQQNGLTQFQTVTDGSSRCFSVVRDWKPKIEKACRLTVDLLDAPTVKGGKYTVVIDPILGGTFVHEAFGHMSEADEYQHDDRLRDIFTLGRRFGPPNLFIYDTGLDIGSRGYIAYDDEGVPAEKSMLIEGGILTGRLHNRESAARFDEKPTGNARCLNYRYPPICRMRNTCIAPGKTDAQDLFSGIKSGVYAVDTHGGTGGEMFSFDAGYGYMITNGKLSGLVRDVQLSGSLWTTLANIEDIANDFIIMDDGGGCGKGEQFPLETTCSSPHLRIRDITVGGTA